MSCSIDMKRFLPAPQINYARETGSFVWYLAEFLAETGRTSSKQSLVVPNALSLLLQLYGPVCILQTIRVFIPKILLMKTYFPCRNELGFDYCITSSMLK